ncbi:hypothetical protein DCS_02211 [Drechmeria coniospora]|uniref:Cell wall protein n=1 Tax=Drechmeria coniospora TaxID=98403 RepID=A0A151GVH5_DRECN|nr:hypothetical protein DCS_02211 [Drechmeria coniospora]KYK61070.1 hypothetical protein DCS_02211 [Drechmeria coniospora]
MKFLAVACVAGSAVASNTYRLHQRDLAAVNGVLKTVSDGIDGLDTAVTGFAADMKPVNAKGAALLVALRDGKSAIEKSSALALADAITLQASVGGLQTKGKSLLDHLKAKKTEIQKGSFCASTRQQIIEINTSSQALIDAIVGKVPADAQAVAKKLAGGLTEVLTQASSEFNEANCKDAGPAAGSSSSSVPAAPVSSASVSSAPVSSAVPSVSTPVYYGNSTMTSKSTTCTDPKSTVTQTTSLMVPGESQGPQVPASPDSPEVAPVGSLPTGTITVRITSTVCPLPGYTLGTNTGGNQPEPTSVDTGSDGTNTNTDGTDSNTVNDGTDSNTVNDGTDSNTVANDGTNTNTVADDGTNTNTVADDGSNANTLGNAGSGDSGSTPIYTPPAPAYVSNGTQDGVVITGGAALIGPASVLGFAMAVAALVL